MILFPAIDLLDGRVVKLRPDEHREVECVYGDPASIADRWLACGARWLHVIDLDAALGRSSRQWEALCRVAERAASAGARLQVGGGIRTDEVVEWCLEDAERVILGTRAVRDPEWLARVAEEHPGQIVVAVEVKQGRVVVEGWQASASLSPLDLLQGCASLPLAGFLYTDVTMEGRGAGLAWETLREVLSAARRPVTVSGGISTLEDLLRLRDAGAGGAVLGSALYSGRLDLAEAIRRLESPSC